MNWKSTWLLVGLAGVLFAFIMLVERRLPDQQQVPSRLLQFRAAEVTNIQLRLTNQLALRVERAKPDSPWQMTVPLSYPAQRVPIDQLLLALEGLLPYTEISAQELKSSKRSIAEFGLDVPQATLTLQHRGQRTEILFGSKTQVGDGVYIQVLDQPTIYIVNGALSDRLPRSHHDWRDIALFSSVPWDFNRLEARSTAQGGFTVDWDPTRAVFVLKKPTVARADSAKVTALLRRIVNSQVLKFVTDNPRVDLEQYGLQPPEVEIAFLAGSNDVFSTQFAVQFGRSPTNDTNAVYARRLSHTNIVLVPREVLESALLTHTDLRDLHLATFNPAQVESIEVIGAESFTVHRQTNGVWMIGETNPVLADPGAVRDWLDLLARLEGSVEKEVVTDFSSPYGLNPPARRYLIRTSLTNATGVVTNRVHEVALGGSQEDRVFARRPDEATLYGLRRADVARLPKAAWELRDRRVWSFTTNQIHRLSVRFSDNSHPPTSRTMQRSATGSWTIVEGAGVIGNFAAIEELMYRLGELRASVWVARGAESRAVFGFDELTDNRVVFELKNGDKPQLLTLEFSRPSPGASGHPASPNGLPYALAMVDGQTWVFEFPPALYIEVINTLFKPMFRSP